MRLLVLAPTLALSAGLVGLVGLGLGCGASIGGGGGGGGDDAGTRPVDARVAVDAAIDARTCAGGDAHATGPTGQCLVWFSAMHTYAEARTLCGALNAHLAYLETAAEDTVAEDLVGTSNTFIGGNDLATEGTFVWDDGTPLAFTNWHTGEPNNGNGGGYQEDCIIIAGARVGKQWDDRPCDASEVATSGSFAYLCEY